MSKGAGQEGEMKVRFLVNRASQKILYMEAGKDFVDVLLGFLQLPVATILSVFNSSAQGGSGTITLEVGSISNVYESLCKLSDSSLVVDKDKLLNPPCPLKLSKANPILLLPAAAPAAATTVYRCSYNAGHLRKVSWASGGYCKYCNGNSMSTPVSIINEMPESPSATSTAASNSCTAGYVQHYLSFIVTDDLTILPASTIESIVLLNKLKVEKMSDLDSVEAVVSPEEALELLKVSFTTRMAVNQVFGSKANAPVVAGKKRSN